jgi:hypothetical protein
MSEREKPDYEKDFKTVEDCEAEIDRLKDRVLKKLKERGQTIENKKAAAKGYNDVIKELEAELDHNVEVVDELKRHMKLLDARQARGSLKSV